MNSCHRSCETCDSQDHCLTCVQGKYWKRENEKEGLCEAVACDQCKLIHYVINLSLLLIFEWNVHKNI